MNIGIVTTWFDRGAAYVSKAYLDTLTLNHKIFIYARGGEITGQGDANWDKSYVTWGTRIHLGIPMFIVWNDFKKWIENNNIETIIFNEQQSWDVVLRTIKLDVKIGAYVDYYVKRTVPFFYLFDFLLCNTQRHYNLYKTHPQSLYIPWGTDCDTYTGDSEPVSKDRIVFFHSAGMNPYRKGTDILVRAFSQVKDDVRLIIHSQVYIKDPTIATLIQQDPRITLIVKTIGAPGLYRHGDVYVYPTRLEGIGLTIAEALASGLPVITVDSAPMNEFVKDGVNGRLVPVVQYKRRNDNYFWDESICNEKALTEAMQFYIIHQSEIKEYKLAARKYAMKHLDWKLNSKPLSKFISDVRRIKKPDSLIRAVAFYEYSRYPSLIASALIRKIGRDSFGL